MNKLELMKTANEVRAVPYLQQISLPIYILKK